MGDTSQALVRTEPNVFLAFDRLDDDQIVAEMKGAALQEYVYEFTEGGQTVRGLSKTGTDDAARIMAVKYGEALREIDCWLEREDEEAAYFKAKVARYHIKDDGTAIEMDSSIGHKRQSKRVVLKSGGSKANPFWYEQGGQKALRNAKLKLMPETIKRLIIEAYVEQGRVRRVRTEDIVDTPRPAPGPTMNRAPAQAEEMAPKPAAAGAMTDNATEKQIKMIWAVATKELSWTDETLHEWLDAYYSVQSVKDLTKQQASEIITELKAIVEAGGRDKTGPTVKTEAPVTAAPAPQQAPVGRPMNVAEANRLGEMAAIGFTASEAVQLAGGTLAEYSDGDWKAFVASMRAHVDAYKVVARYKMSRAQSQAYAKMYKHESIESVAAGLEKGE